MMWWYNLHKHVRPLLSSTYRFSWGARFFITREKQQINLVRICGISEYNKQYSTNPFGLGGALLLRLCRILFEIASTIVIGFLTRKWKWIEPHNFPNHFVVQWRFFGMAAARLWFCSSGSMNWRVVPEPRTIFEFFPNLGCYGDSAITEMGLFISPFQSLQFECSQWGST